MAPKAPTSPTQLLWAHQLKREHGHLLEKVKGLENEMKKIDAAARAASSEANEKIASLTQKLQNMGEGGDGKAIEKLQREMMGRFDDVHAKIEAITIQVRVMDEDGEKQMQQERKQAAQNEKALTNRIKGLEKSLKQYEDRLIEMGNKVDEETLEVIRGQIKHISEQVQNDETNIEQINQIVTVLDAATKELRSKNKTLAKEMKDLATRPVPGPAPPIVPAPAHAPAPVQGEVHPPPNRTTRVTQVIESTVTDQRRRAKGKAAVRPVPTSTDPLHAAPETTSLAQPKARSVIAGRADIDPALRKRKTPEIEDEDSQAAERVESPIVQRRGPGRPRKVKPEPNSDAPEAPAQPSQRRAAPTRKAAAQAKTRAQKIKANPVVKKVQDAVDDTQTGETQGRPGRAAKRKAADAIESQFQPRTKAIKPEPGMAVPVIKKRKLATKLEPHSDSSFAINAPRRAPKKAATRAPAKKTAAKAPATKIAAKAPATKTAAKAPAGPSRITRLSIPNISRSAGLSSGSTHRRRDLTNIYSNSPVSSPPGRVMYETEAEDQLPLQPTVPDVVIADERRDIPQFDSEDSENARALAPYQVKREP